MHFALDNFEAKVTLALLLNCTFKLSYVHYRIHAEKISRRVVVLISTAHAIFSTKSSVSLLAFIEKNSVPTNQWTWLYQALLKVSITKITLWICVYADDWADQSVIKASNGVLISTNYKPHEVHLHTFGQLHHIRQFNKIVCTYLWRAYEFKITWPWRHRDVQIWVHPVSFLYFYQQSFYL